MVNLFHYWKWAKGTPLMIKDFRIWSAAALTLTVFQFANIFGKLNEYVKIQSKHFSNQ